MLTRPIYKIYNLNAIVLPNGEWWTGDWWISRFTAASSAEWKLGERVPGYILCDLVVFRNDRNVCCGRRCLPQRVIHRVKPSYLFSATLTRTHIHIFSHLHTHRSKRNSQHTVFFYVINSEDDNDYIPKLASHTTKPHTHTHTQLRPCFVYENTFKWHYNVIYNLVHILASDILFAIIKLRNARDTILQRNVSCTHILHFIASFHLVGTRELARSCQSLRIAESGVQNGLPECLPYDKRWFVFASVRQWMLTRTWHTLIRF